jgi:hypothetical protein
MFIMATEQVESGVVFCGYRRTLSQAVEPFDGDVPFAPHQRNLQQSQSRLPRDAGFRSLCDHAFVEVCRTRRKLVGARAVAHLVVHANQRCRHIEKHRVNVALPAPEGGIVG